MSLPGADELFRTTGGTTLTPVPRAPDPAGAPEESASAATAATAAPKASAGSAGAGGQAAAASEQDHPADPAGEHGAVAAPRAVGQVPPARGDVQRGEAQRGDVQRNGVARGEVSRADAQRGEASRGSAGSGADSARPVSAATRAAQAASDAVSQPAAARRKPRAPRSRPTGRERHEEKITVYVSAEELFDLEHARLVLRGEYGLAVDRGRIVREAVAVVLADLEQRGEASILVRRLRGR
nr:hypothetical protein [Streptacidiphilus anmyonensis]